MLRQELEEVHTTQKEENIRQEGHIFQRVKGCIRKTKPGQQRVVKHLGNMTDNLPLPDDDTISKVSGQIIGMAALKKAAAVKIAICII